LTEGLNKLRLAMPDMLLTPKDGLAGSIDTGGSLGSSDYETAKLKILREVRKIKNSNPEIQESRLNFLQTFCWQNPTEDCPEEPRGAS